MLLLLTACTWISETELAAELDRDGDGGPVGTDCDDSNADAILVVTW